MNIEIKGISKSFGNHCIFDDFTAMMPEHAITGIMGPSGIGKTTLLRMLVGLEKPDTGMIEGLPEDGVSYIFQDDRLLPWMTVRENIDFVLTLDSERKRIDNVLNLVSLRDAADQTAATLSGGQKKRVAFARAFCKKSSLLLMDEPFNGLDEALKEQIIGYFMKLRESEHPKRTVVLVSHDEELLRKICSHIIIIDKSVSIKSAR